MENILNRISQVAVNENITITSLESKIGASKGVLSRAVKNGTDIQSKWVIKIVENYPQYNARWILTGEGDMLNGSMVSEPPSNYEKSNNTEVLYLDDSKEPEVLFNERTGNKYFMYPDGTIRIEVLKIPFSAYASYVDCFNDEMKLHEEFAVITFKVDHIGRGKYLGFESKGDSMWNDGGYDTPSGSDILGREVGRHLWASGFHKSKYGFILVTKKGIYHKDIDSNIDEDGNILLLSRNPTHKPFKFPINDVNEIYHVIKRSF